MEYYSDFHRFVVVHFHYIFGGIVALAFFMLWAVVANAKRGY